MSKCRCGHRDVWHADRVEACVHPGCDCQKFVKTIDKLPEYADANVEAVREKLLSRSRVGIETYGVTTDRANLTAEEWINHAQQEAMDCAVYLQALLRANSNWIAASTKPAKREPVIAWGILEGETEHAAHEAYLFSGERWHSVRSDGVFVHQPLGDVTHWQPMPKGPNL